MLDAPPEGPLKKAFSAACIAACALLAACGPGEPTKPPPPKADSGPRSAPAAVEAKKDEHHTPDTHGMPGMSELFKGDDKKDEKKETPQK